MFQAFDSWEDMQAALAANMAAADARVRPWQAVMDGTTPDRRYVAIVDDDANVLVFGRISSLDEQLYHTHIRLALLDTTVEDYEDEHDELVEEIASIRDAATTHPHMHFGRWYSVVCPEGELGTNHASRFLPISEAEFAVAQAAGWAFDSSARTTRMYRLVIGLGPTFTRMVAEQEHTP